MRQSRWWLASVLCLAGSVVAEEATHEVRVAGYDFPPYVEIGDDSVSGLTLDLLERLDERLDDYHFEFMEMASRRRFRQFDAHGYDLMLFELPDWGWEEIGAEMTPVLARDSDVYVAHRREGRDQSFFDEVHERRLLGYLGYHYGFAGLETDSEHLEENFDIVLSRSHERNLQLILLDRSDVGEVAILTRSFLDSQIADNPEYRDRLLISERADQEFYLRGMLHPDSKLPIEELNSAIRQLEESGELADLRRQYHLPPEASLSGR